MNKLLSGRWRSCMGVLALILAAPAFGALTDLATAPLETSSATLVKPNIMFILDNSGSMSSAYLPDWADDYSASSYPYLYRNSRFNGSRPARVNSLDCRAASAKSRHVASPSSATR